MGLCSGHAKLNQLTETGKHFAFYPTHIRRKQYGFVLEEISRNSDSVHKSKRKRGGLLFEGYAWSHDFVWARVKLKATSWLKGKTKRTRKARDETSTIINK